jgi:hypothetical protein
MITDYMFTDLKTSLLADVSRDKNFIYEMYRGLKPRLFRANDSFDSLISQEG